jgi:hypothetical protein
MDFKKKDNLIDGKVNEVAQRALQLHNGAVAAIRRGDYEGGLFALINEVFRGVSDDDYSIKDVMLAVQAVVFVGKAGATHAADLLRDCGYHPRRFDALINSSSESFEVELLRAMRFMSGKGAVSAASIYRLLIENRRYRSKGNDNKKIDWMRTFYKQAAAA